MRNKGILIFFLFAMMSFGQSIVTPVSVYNDGYASVVGYDGSQKSIAIGGNSQNVGWITFQTQSIDFSRIASAKLQLNLKSLENPGTLQIRLLTKAITTPEDSVPLTSISMANMITITQSISAADVGKLLQIDITTALKSGTFKGVALASNDKLAVTFASKEGTLAPTIVLTHNIDNGAMKMLVGSDVVILATENGSRTGTTNSNVMAITATASSQSASLATTALAQAAALSVPGMTQATLDALVIYLKQYFKVQFIKQIVAGNEHTVILKTDGSLWAFGYNNFGQLGLGNTINKLSPVQIISSGVQSVFAGYNYTMFVKTDGSLWGFGDNGNYQLGLGNKTNQLNPVMVLSNGVQSVAPAYNHTLIVKTDGSLWAFGDNSFGQLGIGNTTAKFTPVLVISNGVRSASAGWLYSLIVKTNGSLWACGYNGFGQLGNGNTTNQNTFIQVLSSGVQSVSAGLYHNLIIKTDGSLWACGDNRGYQLGNGNTINQSTPIQILSSGVQCAAAGNIFSMFVKTDGSLWGCGNNSYGQLGLGNTSLQTFFIQVPNTGAGVASVTASAGEHSLIVRIDGSLLVCGDNEYGQLGDGTTQGKLVPTLINLP